MSHTAATDGLLVVFCKVHATRAWIIIASLLFIKENQGFLIPQYNKNIKWLLTKDANWATIK